MGEFIGGELTLGYCPEIEGIWRPRIGAIASLDFGSRLITISQPEELPASPMHYIGMTVSPLRFEFDNYAFSLLDAKFSLATTQGPAIWRNEITIISLERRFSRTPQQVGAKTGATDRGFSFNECETQGNLLSLKINYGLDYNLFASLPGGLSYLSFGAGIEFKAIEFELGLTSLARNFDEFQDEWLASFSLSFAPQIGIWNPAIGLGWLYAQTGYVADGYYIYYLDSCSISTFFVSVKTDPLYSSFIREI